MLDGPAVVRFPSAWNSTTGRPWVPAAAFITLLFTSAEIFDGKVLVVSSQWAAGHEQR